MIRIEFMQPQDLEEVADIEKATFSLPWSKKGFASSLEMTDTLYLCAFKNEKLAGYCGMLMVLDEGEITNVAVKENNRGQNIGTLMLQRLLQEGSKRGITRFLLEVRESNEAAIHLYEKLGFAKAGKRRNFYEQPIEDAVIMWK